MAKSPAPRQQPRSKDQLPRDPNPGPAVRGATGAGEAAAGDKAAGRSKRVSAQQQYVKDQQRRKVMKTAALAVLAVVVAMVGLGVWRWAEERALDQPPAAVVAYDNVSGEHTADSVQYEVAPPAGGPHDPVWQNCGYYSQPVRSENAVHSLEHGAVWITYDPSLPADQIETLKKLAEEQDYLIVSPFPGLPAPVVASSWNHQLQLESADDEGLRQFVRVYKQGPDTPEPGAACSGGTDAVAVAS